MPSYVSDATRKAYGIEYTGPPVRARKKRRIVHKKGHVVHQRANQMRRRGHLV